MANLLAFPKNKTFFLGGPHNVQSGNPGVVGDDIAVDFLSSQILGVGRIEMEIMFLIWYWPFSGKVNFNTSIVNFAWPPRFSLQE